MTLVLLDNDHTTVVRRVPEGDARREATLRDLIADYPALLPIHDLDPSYGRLVTVTKELAIPGVGFVDVLLMDEAGRLVVVECKLWRNPQARREVVGQILDYARELSRFGYEDLQRQVSIATRRQGNVLHALAQEAGGTLSEADFVDRVTRDLAAGRFLLLVVGDGIAEGTRRIGEYLRVQPGLAFSFGLIEMAEYRHTDGAGIEHTIMQPRVLAQTTLIERHVIRSEVPGLVIDAATPRVRAALDALPSSRAPSEAANRWRTFSERLLAEMRFDDPGQPQPRNGGNGSCRSRSTRMARERRTPSEPDDEQRNRRRYRDRNRAAQLDGESRQPVRQLATPEAAGVRPGDGGMKAGLFLSALLVIATPVLAKDKKPEHMYGPPPKWEQYRILAEAEITQRLLDPESARIEWLGQYHKGGFKPLLQARAEGYVGCGTVNARNRMGGYAGRTSFVVVIDYDRVLFADIDSRPNGLIADNCSAALRAGLLPPLTAGTMTADVTPGGIGNEAQEVPTTGLSLRAMPDGAYISAVGYGSPASVAGLRPGMVIASVNAIPLAGMGDTMVKIIGAAGPNALLALVGGKTIQLKGRP